MLYFTIAPDYNNDGEYLITKVSTNVNLLQGLILFVKDSDILKLENIIINGEELDINISVYSGKIYELLDSNGLTNKFYDLEALKSYLICESTQAVEINTLVYKEGSLISKTNTTSKSLHKIFNV